MQELTERQAECVKAYRDCNESEMEAARLLGIDIKALRNNLWLAHKKGEQFGPDKYSPAAPAGWECLFSTVQHKDGEVIQQWDRIRPTLSTEQIAQYMASRIPVSSLEFPDLDKCNDHLMLEWPIFDPHHGMLAWAEETGSDYDHKISRHLQIAAGKILFQSFGPVKKSVLILGGDNQTTDNRSGITEISGHSLDVDSRFQKIAWCSYETAVSCIEIAAQFSDEVLVVVLSGNHDYHSAIHLTIQLHAHFRNVKKITVDCSPEKHRFYRWGNTVFMATHGEIPDKRVGPFALQQVIRRGFASHPSGVERVMVRMGHLHKRGRKTPDMLTEEDGVIIERFPTLAAQEAYSVESGYTSVRATSANLWHHQHGKYGGREITLGEILERYPYQEQP